MLRTFCDVCESQVDGEVFADVKITTYDKEGNLDATTEHHVCEKHLNEIDTLFGIQVEVPEPEPQQA